MMHKEPFSIKKRLASFGYALNGIFYLFRNEHNAWVHGSIAVCVLLISWWLKLSSIEWVVVIMMVGAVLAAEAINTAVEMLADEVTTEYRVRIKHAKDLAAASVMLTAIASVVAGAIIFIPKIIALIW